MIALYQHNEAADARAICAMQAKKYFRETVANGISEQLNKNITALKLSYCV